MRHGFNLVSYLSIVAVIFIAIFSFAACVASQQKQFDIFFIDEDGIEILVVRAKDCKLKKVTVHFNTHEEVNKICQALQIPYDDEGNKIEPGSKFHGCVDVEKKRITIIDDPYILYHEFNHLRDSYCTEVYNATQGTEISD